MSRPSIAVLAMTVATVALAAPAHAAPFPDRIGQTPPRTAISFTHSPSGFQAGSPNQHEARSGLSIVKLYIADYVFDHGSAADHAAAVQMLRTSDDGIATALYTRYPDSIAATARKYGLRTTHAGAAWGASTTSTYDSAAFLEARKRDHGLGDPILVALATATPVAADGYRQDYGTAQLPGVIGTKWGWSDDRTSAHASVSYGTDFTVAAHTYGPAAQLTADVAAAFDAPPAASPAERAITDAAAAAHAAVDSATDALAGAFGSSAPAAQAVRDAAKGPHASINDAAARARDVAQLSSRSN
ncbi:hypothetical protein [Corynebacterium timonense]|uniref:Beta-lactamase enzyme family protein n=1 Tax=Corynebacterium timonense TaxID=441500 RepID=A0A1H1RKJ2_9CORY|nr:hypothetical protein [Corynebacterium timonense]SDS36218.1 hypothetical protein SAMN04488539_1522 [Corynebacterium timonense]